MLRVTPAELLDQIEATRGQITLLPNRSLDCRNITPELIPELKRYAANDVLAAILAGECEGPSWPPNPSSKACMRCDHEPEEHYPSHTWSCKHCDCRQWRKKPGEAGIEIRNQGDATEPFLAEFRICRCGHDDMDHVRTESELGTCCGVRLCGCPEYRKPKIRKVKLENRHEQPSLRI